MTDRRGFRPDIEGLRGVAVLLVVAGHATGWPRGGFLGVDVFFVLSGFLITGLLAGESERTGRIRLRRFYARRVRRLLPAGVLVLLVTDLAAAFLLLPSRAHATVVDSLWALGFLANVRFADLGADYFSQTRPPSAVQHYWSLSVEEQFYVVWPTLTLLAVAVAVRRHWSARRTMAAAAATVVVVSFGWSVLSTAATPVSAYFSAATRAWELGAGALLALAGPAARSRRALAATGAVLLTLSVLLIGPESGVPGYVVALPVLATLALLAGSPPWLATPVLTYLGRISYSLYLWHWPVLVLAADLPGGASAAGITLAVLVALGLSVLTHHLVEAPVRASSWLTPTERPRHARRRPLFAPAMCASAATVLAATYLLTSASPTGPGPRTTAVQPVPTPQVTASRGRAVEPDLAPAVLAGLALTEWPDSVDTDLTGAGAPEWLADRCLDIGERNLDKCAYGPDGATRTVAVLGDSVGVSWLPALRAATGLRGWRIQVLTRRQCPNAAIPGGTTRAVSESCAGHQQWALGQVQRLRPDLLVLSNGYDGAGPQEWRQATAAALAALMPLADRTVVLAPPPETGNLQKCRTRRSAPPQCTRAVTGEWTAVARAERAGAVAHGATWVDTRRWFCLQDRCPAVVAGMPVHFDGKHLSQAYARFLGPQLTAVLQD